MLHDPVEIVQHVSVGCLQSNVLFDFDLKNRRENIGMARMATQSVTDTRGEYRIKTIESCCERRASFESENDDWDVKIVEKTRDCDMAALTLIAA